MKTSSARETTSFSSSAPPVGQPGRPSILSDEITRLMCDVIRRVGISDSAAGLLAGASTSSVSRWKQSQPEFKRQLGQARAQFIVPRLEAIGQTRRRDGSLDWRAQKWLIEYAEPERFGKPSRRRSAKKVKVDPKVEPAPGQVVVTPEQLKAMQQRRLERLTKMESVPEDEALWILAFGLSAPYPGPGWQEQLGVPPKTKEPGRPRPESPKRHPGVIPKTPGDEAAIIASAPEETPRPEPAPAPIAQNVTFLPKTPLAQGNSTSSPAAEAGQAIPKTPAAPERHGAGAPRLLERVGRLFKKSPAPAAEQPAARAREAAELEAHRRAVEAMENAPDLYPAYEPREEDARCVPPGTWAGY